MKGVKTLLISALLFPVFLVVAVTFGIPALGVDGFVTAGECWLWMDDGHFAFACDGNPPNWIIRALGGLN